MLINHRPVFLTFQVLFSDGWVETSQLLADLCQQEVRKQMAITAPVDPQPSSSPTPTLPFYLSLPSVSYTHALNLRNNFTSIGAFLTSSAKEIERKGKMSANRAGQVYNYISRQFDPKALPSGSK